MQSRSTKKQALSLVAVIVFMISMVYAGTSAAVRSPLATIATSRPSASSEDPWSHLPHEVSQDYPDNGTFVGWDQNSNSTSDEWTWEHTNWLFGPSPSFKIYHENGSLLTADSYAEIDETIIFEVTVPKSIFTGGASLGRVSFNGWYLSSDWNFSANFNFGFDAGPYASEPWYGWSSQWNESDEGGTPLPGFMDLVVEECSNHSDSTHHYVSFAVKYNEHAPLGLYELHMEVQDTDYNWIGSYNFGSGWEFQGIAVGIPPDEAWSFSYGGSYTLQKIDMAGDVLYSISREEDFIMRFNVSDDVFEYIILTFIMPGGIDKLVNVTGWHTAERTTTGAWEYNADQDTYEWNASKEVTYFEEVYGPYQERRWSDLGNYMEVNVTVMREQWNETTDTWDRWLENETQWVQKQLYFIYNVSTGFETKFGYTYWGWPHDELNYEDWNEEIMVFEPIPPELPILYELNASECVARPLGKDFVVDFVGHFTEKMPTSNQYSDFRFRDTVMGAENMWYSPAVWGDNPRQTQTEYEMAKQIAIEIPVTIAKLLLEDGSEPNGWMFHVDKGENFMVRGRLQGGSDVASDIDGVMFELNAYDGHWSEDESRWSELIYVIQFDSSGIATHRAFNHTQKYNYTYGTYWDWVYTNMTGWHYVYDEDTNMWEWQYGEYWEWDWMEVEDWHWQWWYYNQKEGKWQKNWVNRRSAETRVDDIFCMTSNYTKWTSEGDLFVTFLVNMSQSVPDTNYWWDFAFLNNTWYTDYSSEYGQHEIMTWNREWVYSFMHDDQKVYVEPVDHAQLAFEFVDGIPTGETQLGTESPYIIIDGVKEPIKVIENYDPWSGYTWEEMFFYDHWDPATGKDYYKYILKNTTEILVTYTEAINLYNVTTSTGDTFITAMEYERWWDHGGTSYAWWMDINGQIHQGGSEYEKWNLDNSSFYDKVDLEFRTERKYVRYGLNGILNISEWWWESKDSTYYMTDLDGNLYELVYDPADYRYMAYLDGAWHHVSWPEYYYEGQYEGSDVILATWNVRRSWHYDDGAKKHEMPYPGANAYGSWDLNTKESGGGSVPTAKSLLYNGNAYTVNELNETHGTVKIAGTVYTVHITTRAHTAANGTSIWDPNQAGYTASIGTYDNNLAFSEIEKFAYHDSWDGNAHYDGYDDFEYLPLTNGTTWIVNETYVTCVFEYDYYGQSVYSMQEWPYWYSSGNESWHEYELINGTIIMVDDYVELPRIASYRVEIYYDGYDYYEFMGQQYNATYWGTRFRAYKLFNATMSGDVYVDMRWGQYHPYYEFTYDGELKVVNASYESINKMRLRWGHKIVYGPTPIKSTVYKNFYDAVIGVPKWGMWGVQRWTVNQDNGALDLDGDLSTTDDQFFIREEYSSTDSWTHEWDWMNVWIDWNPNGTLFGDEMHIESWMGLDTFTWSHEWNQTFYWYHASDFSSLGEEDMQSVRDTLLTEYDDPKPGYWDIAWMAKNVTWADIVAEAEEQGWDWITSNEQSWTWLSFGVGQNYGTTVMQDDVEHWLDIGMHYEYSGLMVWEDKNENDMMDVDLTNPGTGELSHYLIPDSVDGVSFVTPGQAYGNSNSSDFMHLGITDEVTWGVAFSGINGTVFPFTLGGYWGWYDGMMTGSDMTTFDERPTKVTVDELSFLVHFQGYVNGTTMNNYAEIKVDNYVGNWQVHRLGGRSNIENKSLALNYFADVRMSDFAFKANGTMTDSESTISSDRFEFETAGARFAEMIMGGVTYDWGKNTTAPYDVVSYTTPVGTFRAAFESSSGKSATTWSFSSSMFYVTIGFPEWGGYSVFQDPVFVSYVSNRGTLGGPGEPVQFGTFSISPTAPTGEDTVRINAEVLSSVEVFDVELVYWTDTESPTVVSMWEESSGVFAGDIPPFAEDTQVYCKIVVHTEAGVYESEVQSYIVGQGIVITTTTTTTTTTGEPGPGLDLDMMVLLGGVALVVVILGVLVSKRKK